MSHIDPGHITQIMCNIVINVLKQKMVKERHLLRSIWSKGLQVKRSTSQKVPKLKGLPVKRSTVKRSAKMLKSKVNIGIM